MVSGFFPSIDSQEIYRRYFDKDWVIGWDGLMEVYLSSTDTLYIEAS